MGNCPVSLPPPEPLLEDDKYKTVKTQQQQQQQERNESPRSVMLSLETNPNSSQQQNKNNNHNDPTPFKWEPHRALLPRHSILDPDEVRGILMHQGMELAWRDEQTARQNMIGTNNLLDESLEDKDNARNHDPHDSNQYNDDEDAHTELSTSTMALTDVTRKISNADRYSLRPALLSASSSSRRRLRLAPRQIGLTQKSPNAKRPNSNPQQPSPDSKLSGSSDSSMSQAAFQKSLLKLSSSTHTGNNTTGSAISVPGASRRLLSSFSACSGTTGAGTTTTTSTPTMASQSVSSHENGSNHAPNKGPVASKAGCQLIPAGFSSSTTTNANNHTPNTTSTSTTTDHANHMTPHFHHHFYPIHWEHFVVLELAMKAHWVDYYQTHYKAAFPHDRFLLSNNSNSHNNHHSAKSPVQGMEEEEVMIRMGIDPQIPFLHLCMTGSLGLVERCRRTNHDLNSNMARMKDGRKDARHFLVLQHALSFKPICVCALKAKPQKQASGSSTLSAVDPQQQQQQQQPQPPRQDVIRMYATKPRSAGQRQAATTADLGLSQRENETSLPLYAWAELVVVNLESVTDVSNVQYKLHFFSKHGTCEERPTLWGRHTTSGSDHGASLAIDWIGRTDGETRDAGCGQISINDRHQFSVKVARGIDPAPLLCVAAIVDELVEYRLRRACKIKKMAQRLPPQTPTKKNNSR